MSPYRIEKLIGMEVWCFIINVLISLPFTKVSHKIFRFYNQAGTRT